MTTQETIDYVKSLKASASKDTDKRAEKYVEAIKLIDEHRCLQNRCFVLSSGMMCGRCNMECHALGKGEIYG